MGAHGLHLVSARPADLAHGRAAVAAVVPGHYAAEEQVARILKRLGRPEAAAFIEGKLPTTKSIRSGDLGEILATEYIATLTPYQVPIQRLRWKDHRNMAMRGDDVIGMIRDPGTGRLRFLKAEAKSRAALAAGVIGEARAGLDKDAGLPSAHALEFISARLMEAGDTDLADAIDDALLNHGLRTVPNTKSLIRNARRKSPSIYMMQGARSPRVCASKGPLQRISPTFLAGRASELNAS